MISGKLPFAGESFQEIASQHFNEDPPPLHRLNISVTLKVSNLVKKMMEKLPEDRFPDYEMLLKSLWNLRHATAPDSSLIPDIHTISIHHLDYNLQKKSYKNIESTRKKVKQLKGRRDALFWTLLTVFPVPIIVLVVFLFIMESNKEPSITNVYGNKCKFLVWRYKSSEYLLPQLKQEMNALLVRIENVKHPTLRQELLLWQLRYYIQHVECQQLKNRLRNQKVSLENRIKRELHPPEKEPEKK